MLENPQTDCVTPAGRSAGSAPAFRVAGDPAPSGKPSIAAARATASPSAGRRSRYHRSTPAPSEPAGRGIRDGTPTSAPRVAKWSRSGPPQASAAETGQDPRAFAFDQGPLMGAGSTDCGGYLARQSPPRPTTGSKDSRRTAYMDGIVHPRGGAFHAGTPER